MVRLRKNRWYSIENQHRIGQRAASQSSGSRRLISLIFLLALVLLMMQKANDPEVVRRAFQSLGVPLDRDIVATSRDDSLSGTRVKTRPNGKYGSNANQLARDQDPDESHDLPYWTATCDDLIPRVLEQATPKVVGILAKFLFSLHTTPSESGNSTLTNSTTEQAGAVEEFVQDAELHSELASVSEACQTLIEKARRELSGRIDERPSPNSEDDQKVDKDKIWLAQLDRFWLEWQNLIIAAGHHFSSVAESDKTPGSIDQTFRGSLANVLDQRLLAGLRDAAPWRSSENLAFWRLLQRGLDFDFSAETDPPLISTQQLEADFVKLRGEWIRFRGSVRRVDFVERSQPEFLNGGYWVVWLRGDDGSNLPVAVYTGNDFAKQLATSISKDEFPDVEVIGLVGKRLAYASQTGIQISPTIFAGILIQFAQDSPAAFQRSGSEIASQLFFAGLVSVLICLALLLPIWFQIRRKARKGSARSVRHLTLLASVAVAISLSSKSSQQMAHADDQATSRSSDQLSAPWASGESGTQSIEGIAQQRLEGVFQADSILGVEQLISGSRSIPSDSVLKLLHTLNQVGFQRLWSLDRSFEVGAGYRIEPVQLAGWAIAARRVKLSESQQERFSLDSRDSVFVLTIELHEGLPQDESLTSVICRNLPAIWLDSETLYQPVQITGFALHARDTSTDGLASESSISPICIFSEAPQWVFSDVGLDTQQQFSPELPAHWLELGVAGWDLNWLELLRIENEKSLSSQEREPLLKLLQISRDGTLKQDSPAINPIDVLRQPVQYFGATIDWKVRLVTGSLVNLKTNQDGLIDSYYQFDGFVKIPGQKVDYVASNGTDRILFDGEFPVTVVMAADSDFVPQDRLAAGQQSWKIGRHARVQGRFFRLWSYRSERLGSETSRGRQLAPLVIGVTLEPARPDPIPTEPTGWFAVALCFGVVLIMLGIIIAVFKDTFSSAS